MVNSFHKTIIFISLLDYYDDRSKWKEATAPSSLGLIKGLQIDITGLHGNRSGLRSFQSRPYFFLQTQVWPNFICSLPDFLPESELHSSQRSAQAQIFRPGSGQVLKLKVWLRSDPTPMKTIIGLLRPVNSP